MKSSIIESWKRFVISSYAVAHDRSQAETPAQAESRASQPGQRDDAGEMSLFLDWISGFAWLG